MAIPDKVVVVTKRTPLQELTDRFGTKAQAKFYIQQAAQQAVAEGMAGAMAPAYEVYEQDDLLYQSAISRLRAAIPGSVRTQFIDSGYLPTFTFGTNDLVVVIGPDGLVVNTAKYLDGQPVLAVNPDPRTIEGVLLPFSVDQFRFALSLALTGKVNIRSLTMAEACLEDGQTMLALNDLFIGQRTHVSARYRIGCWGMYEDQSSSGIIVSTGTGSTGWFRSVVTGALQIKENLEYMDEPDVWEDPKAVEGDYRFGGTDRILRFAVREPWVSKTTSAKIVLGEVTAEEEIEIVSQMPQNGCIFSDGIEADYLPFNSGAVARIRVAKRRVSLVIP